MMKKLLKKVFQPVTGKKYSEERLRVILIQIFYNPTNERSQSVRKK